MADLVAIDHAAHPRVGDARALFLEYAQSLEFDLGFQDFDEEMSRFPAGYLPPGGALLVAVAGDAAVGCVGARRIDARICEMKRLYVRPVARGGALGRRLAEAIMARAREAGYRRMRLDTVPSMVAAQALYNRIGFREIPAYRYNPVPDTRYLEADL